LRWKNGEGGRLETVTGGEEDGDGMTDSMKGKFVHEIGRDGKCRCGQTTNQDNDSLDETNYSLRTHMEWSDSLAYEHCKDEEKESKDIQKYVKRHNQVSDETNIRREICCLKSRLAYD
jgi:hypothetical protein